VCELVTSKNQIKRDKSTPTFQLVVASVSNNNASSFDDKPSSTFQLVVVSVDWISKGISNKPFRTLHLNRIKSKMPFTFQLIVGSKQVHQKKPQRNNANLQTTNDFQGGSPSHFNVGCLHELIIGPEYVSNSQLVVVKFRQMIHQGIQAKLHRTIQVKLRQIIQVKFCQVIQEKLHQVTSATICNNSSKLIDTLASEGVALHSEVEQPAPTLLCDKLCKKSYGLVSRNLTFGRNELIEFTLAFDCNHKELIKLNDVSPSNKLIVEYSDNPSMQSCPSAFQLIVASVVWLPNATSARIKHPSSSK